jgi:multidrug efflux pump subunit AcrB
VDAPIEIRALGWDLQNVQKAATLVVATLRGIPEAVDVRTNMGLGVPTIRFRIDDASAARHGLSRSDVALAVQGRTRGLEVGQYRAGEDPVPILIRSAAGEEYRPRNLDSIDVAKPRGKPVPLALLAESDVQWLPAVIHHRDRKRLVTVSAQLAEGATYSRVLEKALPALKSLDLPAGARVEVGGAAEESEEANSAMFMALPLGIMVLIVILMAEFNSIRKVSIILVTVPLAATGVIPGLLIGGQPFGFMSLLGVFALAGVVVNNAIVLLDHIELIRKRGATIREAIAESITARTRPILLTTATTVLGLLPLALSSSNLWPPLAWAMISGLIASTALTLLVAPALYQTLFLRQAEREIVRTNPA